jgi:probable H4MPT-linked C1 transfer pathway protein
MTGELVDCFNSREQGVAAILETLQNKIADPDMQIFVGTQGFLPIDHVQPADYLNIASANWIASAELTARHFRNGLFVDIGSTTTDILLISNHTLKALGYTDYQRLVSGELVYTGVIRTAVMAVAQQAEFKGQSMGLMAEYFATMADVYRLTGDLNPAHDQTDTADGADKSPAASALRLSRMTGYDFTEQDWPIWLAFADNLKQQQKQRIKLACQQQLQRQTPSDPGCLIGAGVGRFLIREIAKDLGLAYFDFTQLFKQAHSISAVDAADCAPAVAVAYLAGGFG